MSERAASREPLYSGPPLDYTGCHAEAQGNVVSISAPWAGGYGASALLPDPESALAVARLFNLAAELRLGYDGDRDHVILYGQRYTRHLLAEYGAALPGTWLVVSRDDGVLVLQERR